MPKISLPPTEKILVEGGDTRIILSNDTGFNRYYCKPMPDPDLWCFGSSTASIISESAFAAADRLRNRLVLEEAHSAAEVYADELQRIRQELLRLWGLSDLSGLEFVFAASGTDLHLIAAQILKPSLILMVEASETGSGVPDALMGRHFSARTALGLKVNESMPLGESEIEVQRIAIRHRNGDAIDSKQVDEAFEALASRAVLQGQRVLIVMVDQSKTGLIAPSLACLLKLRQTFPGAIDILVDACQFRISAETLRFYLQHDFWLALTGSKFIGGPTFSGALLMPSTSAEPFKKADLPRVLKAYSSQADWPKNWTVDCLKNKANFGLLLRWEAALTEQSAFSLLPKSEVLNFVRAFEKAMSDFFSENPCLKPLGVPSLNRSPWLEAENWDKVQTIFPFLLYHSQALDKPLTIADTQRIYFLLQQADNLGLTGMRIQLGQPVRCGIRNEAPVSALRLCLSARLIHDAVAERTDVIGNALKALDQINEHLKKFFRS